MTNTASGEKMAWPEAGELHRRHRHTKLGIWEATETAAVKQKGVS